MKSESGTIFSVCTAPTWSCRARTVALPSKDRGVCALVLECSRTRVRVYVCVLALYLTIILTLTLIFRFMYQCVETLEDKCKWACAYDCIHAIYVTTFHISGGKRSLFTAWTKARYWTTLRSTLVPPRALEVKTRCSLLPHLHPAFTLARGHTPVFCHSSTCIWMHTQNHGRSSIHLHVQTYIAHVHTCIYLHTHVHTNH